MMLYLMRHGDAVPRAASDAERPLSTQGSAQVARAAAHLMDVQPDLLLVSPYVRAQQTANIVKSTCKWNVSITTEAGITPDDSVADVLQCLDQHSQHGCSQHGSVVVVSHNPLLSNVLWRLLDDQGATGGMATASIAYLDLPVVGVGQAQLGWLKHTPLI